MKQKYGSYFSCFYLVIQKIVQTVEQRLNSSLLYQWRWVNPLHPNTLMIQGWYCKKKLDACHS